jgi:precorrin-2/cobalt-factor-2 C20-methyltransferase
MEKNKIFGIALGPGDPDLITLKALKTLKEMDVIYYPGTMSKQGEKTSFSKRILDNYCLDESKLKGIFISMSMDRSATEFLYDASYREIRCQHYSGKKIAIVSEGDLSFYSTFAYFIEKFNKDNVDFEMIPGVPAFILAGSAAKIPLVLQQDKMMVVPAPISKKEVLDALEVADTVVVMKLTTLRDDFLPLLEDVKGRFVYCEKLGTNEQFVSTDIEEIRQRKNPYFSLLVINKYV